MVNLFHSQHPRPPPFRCPLLFVPPVKRHGAGMVATYIIEVFDFVDADNPIFARVGFFECAELWSFRWEARPSHPVLGLPGREQGVEIVVGHLVPVAVR
jgi:hypothetical protein